MKKSALTGKVHRRQFFLEFSSKQFGFLQSRYNVHYFEDVLKHWIVENFNFKDAVVRIIRTNAQCLSCVLMVWAERTENLYEQYSSPSYMNKIQI